MEGLELTCFQIISTVGTARSLYIEAIQEAKVSNIELWDRDKISILIKENKDYLTLDTNESLEEDIDEYAVQKINTVLGNMLLFLPYGFFVSYYLINRKPMLTLVLTIIASFSIELVQLSIGRVFDIDDILLNLLGGYLGYLLYYWLSNLYEKIPRVFKNEIVLNVLSGIILVGVISLL